MSETKTIPTESTTRPPDPAKPEEKLKDVREEFAPRPYRRRRWPLLRMPKRRP